MRAAADPRIGWPVAANHFPRRRPATPAEGETAWLADRLAGAKRAARFPKYREDSKSAQRISPHENPARGGSALRSHWMRKTVSTGFFAHNLHIPAAQLVSVLTGQTTAGMPAEHGQSGWGFQIRLADSFHTTTAELSMFRRKATLLLVLVALSGATYSSPAEACFFGRYGLFGRTRPQDRVDFIWIDGQGENSRIERREWLEPRGLWTDNGVL